MEFTLKKLVTLTTALATISLPVLAQQQNPVPGPYQVMVVPMTPRAMTPENLDPRNVFPTYAPTLPYWMQTPTAQQASPQTKANEQPSAANGQPSYAQQQPTMQGQQNAPRPQVRYLPPPAYSQNNGYPQGYGNTPNYGYNPNYGRGYGPNYSNTNNTWGMPSFTNAPWGNNGNWTPFNPFQN